MYLTMCLLVHDKRSAQRVYSLRPGIVKVGRMTECAIRLPDSSVSRLHAEFVGDAKEVSVRDLQSRNGTFVNERRVDSIHRVSVGDSVRFGHVKCDVVNSAHRDIASFLSLEEESTQDRALPIDQNGFQSAELTQAQDRVVRLLVAGSSEKDVARLLDLSPHTVHAHVKEIYRIKRVHSRAELLALYLGNGSRTFEFGNDDAPRRS